MDKRENCNVYIDEAGDLGYKSGTHWFCMTAVIVKESDEKSIRSTLKQIKEKINVNYIHFVKIKEFNRRIYLVNELSKENFTVVSVIVDTKVLEIAKKSTLLAYNYVSRFLIERVSWYLRDHNLMGQIVFSARSSKFDQELIDYVNYLLNSNYNQIYSSVINKVAYKKATDWDLLQLADVCASAIFHACEPDRYGFKYPCFYLLLEPHLYKYNGSTQNYGIKFYPSNADLASIKSTPSPCNQ